MSTGLVIPANIAAKLKETNGGQTCSSCRWRYLPPGGKSDIECRRHAPMTSTLLVPVQGPAIHRQRPQMALQPKNFSTFPLIMDDFWCGDWETARPAATS